MKSDSSLPSQVVDWKSIAQDFVSSKDDEACLMLLLRMHCIFGDIRRLLKTKKVSGYRFEYSVSGGRIDMVLFHTDGGISLVEAKGNCSTREVVSGIGQLFYYEAMFLESAAKRPEYINKFLVAPVGDVVTSNVSKACDLAGVEFIQYPSFDLIRSHRNDCISKWVWNGA